MKAVNLNPRPSLTEQFAKLFGNLATNNDQTPLALYSLIKRLLVTAVPVCSLPKAAGQTTSDKATYLATHLTPFTLTSVQPPPSPGVYLCLSGSKAGFSTWDPSGAGYWTHFFYDLADPALPKQSILWTGTPLIYWSGLDYKVPHQDPSRPKGASQ